MARLRLRLARADKPLAEDNKTFSASCLYLAYRSARGDHASHRSLSRQFFGRLFMAAQKNVIAIVDDDSDIREALEHLLSLRGYRIETYASAEEFIDAATATEASCLVVDMQLGDILGVELCRHLSANGFKFPIIFMTGCQSETLQKKAMDFGCIAYLHKPFATDRLIEAVAKATGVAPHC
jgi:CheY-like chemotaxis protein